jgi:uncharacterized membrane protein YphA (DoxX/SURF4 family)
MSNATRIFLVILRLAIGWHFAVEGYHKIHSVWTGPTETSRPWTSAGYLREASGPFAPMFREMAGDLDQQALDRLKLRPLHGLDDPERTPAINRFPAALSDDWQYWFDGFVQHYQLSEEQKIRAKEVFVRQKEQTADWLLKGVKEVKKNYPSGQVQIKLTTAQRVAEYEAKLDELADLLKRELPAFGEDVRKQKLTALKGEINRTRGELNADLEEHATRMKSALDALLTPDQKKQDAFSVEPPRDTWQVWKWPRVEIIDWATRWGLLIVGLCLLAGFCTPAACLAGACFLLMFYLSMPPLPGVPEVAKSEGTYLFVNKNLIELLALLVIATTRSGRWMGLDGFITALWRRRKAGP